MSNVRLTGPRDVFGAVMLIVASKVIHKKTWSQIVQAAAAADSERKRLEK